MILKNIAERIAVWNSVIGKMYMASVMVYYRLRSTVYPCDHFRGAQNHFRELVSHDPYEQKYGS